MSDSSRGCLKSFLIAIFVILLLICAYSSFTIQIELDNLTNSISIDESLLALGSHLNLDVNSQLMEKEILQQKQNVWYIILAATLCALIITLIVFKKSPEPKTIEHKQAPQDAGSRLEALNDLLKNNLISQNEYDEKKKEIIKTI